VGADKRVEGEADGLGAARRIPINAIGRAGNDVGPCAASPEVGAQDAGLRYALGAVPSPDTRAGSQR